MFEYSSWVQWLVYHLYRHRLGRDFQEEKKLFYYLRQQLPKFNIFGQMQFYKASRILLSLMYQNARSSNWYVLCFLISIVHLLQLHDVSGDKMMICTNPSGRNE